MLTINLFFRPSERSNTYPGRLFIRLIRHRRVKMVTLKKFHIYHHEWDGLRRQVILPGDNPARATYLIQLQQRARQEVQRLHEVARILSANGDYALEKLMQIYHMQRKQGSLSVLTQELAAELDQQNRSRTARAYRTASRKLLAFVGDEDLSLEKIDAHLLNAYEMHLRRCTLKPNTISYYMRNLRAIYNKAVVRKLIARPVESPFIGVYTGVARTDKRALESEEVARIINLQIARPDGMQNHYERTLSRAQRYFSFCFYACGMCFVDLAHLKKEDIRGNRLCYIRKKTGRQIEIGLTRAMREIIDSFALETRFSPYLFPIIRNTPGSTRRQYENALRLQNMHLKGVASLAGVIKPLSTHWARHSWATAGKRASVPTAVISECLGHSSEKVTRIYLASFEHHVLDEANRRVIELIDKQCCRIT